MTKSLAAGAERRILWLTLAVGLAAAAAAALWGRLLFAAGLAAGTLLAVLNMRWLQQLLNALVRLAQGAGEGRRGRIPFWTYARFFGRYALIGLVIYVMFARFDVPVVSVLLGLLALGAATMLEGIYEAIRGSK